MKFTWITVILLLVFVAIFSVQNAEPITVHFLSWEIAMSAALVIQLAALIGGLVGLAVGATSRRAPAAPSNHPHSSPAEPVQLTHVSPEEAPTAVAPVHTDRHRREIDVR